MIAINSVNNTNVLGPIYRTSDAVNLCKNSKINGY